MVQRTFSVPVIVLFAGLMMGCSNQPRYAEGYQYMPPTSRQEMRLGNDPPANIGPAAVATSSVVGVRLADNQAKIPDSIEVKIRLDNNGPAMATLDPASLQVLTGEYVPLPAPKLDPASTLYVSPGGSQVLTANFPFPPGRTYEQMKLNNVRLKYVVNLDKQSFPMDVPFYYLP